MLRQYFGWGMVICGLFLATGMQAHGQLLPDRASPRIGEIIDTKGDEDFLGPEIGDWRAALIQQPLVDGDMLRTGAYGGLGVVFDDRTQLRLHANSRLQVSGPKGGARDLKLSAGKLWSRASGPDRSLSVETPTATAAIRGTDWFMEVLADGTSRLVVLDGHVRYYNAIGEVMVGPGTSAIARPGEAPEIEIIVETKDRPRWAIIPRSDWAVFLPVQDVIDDLEGDPLRQGYMELAEGYVAELRSGLAGQAGADNGAASVAGAILAIADRAPATALEYLGTVDAAALSPDLSRLALIAEAGAMLDLANLTGSAATLERYETAFGADTSSRAMRAYLEIYAGRYDVAQTIAKEINPEDGDVRFAFLNALLAIATGDDAALDAETARAITLVPENANAWLWRSLYLVTAGGATLDEAEAALTRVVTLNPGSASGWTAIGQMKLAAGDPDAAMNAFDRALAIVPQEPYALAGKAFVHIRQDRLPDAEALIGSLSEAERLHPEIQSAIAVMRLMQGRAVDAEEATGRMIAANPGRPGAATLDSIAHWHSGRRDLAIRSIRNAIRLDPNDGFTALAGSVMAQDQYRAGEAINLARAAIDADTRNRRAGLIDIPASQSGRIDAGSAFRNLGLAYQGETYSSRSASQFSANTAFSYAGIWQDDFARQSGVTTGLLLDPLAVSFPLKFAQFYRMERVESEVSASASYGDAGSMSANAGWQLQGLTREGGDPLAFAVAANIARDDAARENDGIDSGSLLLRFGTVKNGRDGFVGRLSVSAQDASLPGQFAPVDADDTERSVNGVVDLGYTRINSWNDRWLARMAYGHGETRFSNPSAFGNTLSDIDFSLAASLGLAAAQDFAVRGLYDSTFSLPGQLILAANPPPAFPATTQVGLGLVPLTEDEDPVRGVWTNADIFSAQARRILSAGDWDLSFGLEYGWVQFASRREENQFLITGVGAISDFDNLSVTVFDLGEAYAVTEKQETRSSMLQAHVHGLWRLDENWRLEAGIFPVLIRSELDAPAFGVETASDKTSLDPRIGLAWEAPSTQIRLAAQRTRAPVGIDTIAPIGTLGLLPDQGRSVSAVQTDSVMARLDHEFTPRIFLSLRAEHQALEDASAARDGDRLEASAFYVPEADIDRYSAALEVQLGDRSALSAAYTGGSSEITAPGTSGGNALPLLAEEEAMLTYTWVDPRFFRTQVGISYIGKRFADAANLIPLDEAFVFSGAVLGETRDKTWQWQLSASATASDDDPNFTGRKASKYRFGLRIARRM